MTAPIIRGLTLWRPWAWAMANDKPIENRSWAPPDYLVGNWIALHAGLKFDAEAFEDMRSGAYTEAARRVPERADHPAGVIVAVGRLAGFFLNGTRGGVYAFGPVCWELPIRHRLKTPVVHKGAQGLWKLHPDALKAVAEQVDLESAA